MLKQTRGSELALMTKVGRAGPADEPRRDVRSTTLIPAFVLSELRSAFIIGFVDLHPVPGDRHRRLGALMSLGMMMLPPVMVSLPFKLLLFVLVDGWGLIINALVASYRSGGAADDRQRRSSTSPCRRCWSALKLSAPILVTALVIGFAVSLFQSVTQIQEFTLAFVPKAIGVGVALLLCGNWMLHEMVTFTVQLYSAMPQILQTG